MAKPRSKFKKVKWLFGKEIEIPEEWEIHTVESVSKKIVSGGTPSTTMLEYWNGNIPWTRSSVLLDPYLKSGEKFITAEGLRNSSSVLIPKNNLLVSSRVSVGNISISAIDVAISQDVTGIIINKAYARSEFLYWYLKQHIKKLVLISQGTTIQGFTRKELAKLLVFLPSLSEQQKIASVLSGVDALIESTQKVIEKTERLKKGLMQKLLTKGIGHTKFKKVKWHFEREIKIPEEWVLQKFDEVVKTNPPTKIKQNIVPYIPMDAIDTEKPSFNYFEERRLFKNSSLPKFQNNDVLFARITPSTENGKTSIVENFGLNGVASSELTVLRASKMVLPRYLYYYIKSYRIRQFAISQMMGTTGRQRVPNSVFKKVLNFELPPLSEQQKIASILSSADAYIQKNQEYKKKMELLKKGLMQKLLTGQIRVKVDH